MKLSNMIATYWGLDANTLLKVYTKFNKILNKAVLVSKQRLIDIGDNSDYVFFDISVPSYKMVYLSKNGDIIKYSDMTETEVEEAVVKGACIKVSIADIDNTSKNSVTVCNNEQRGNLLKTAFVDIQEAIKVLGKLFEGILGVEITESDIKLLDETAIDSIDIDKVEAILNIVRTFAINSGKEDILKAGFSDSTVEKAMASVNANYVYTALK